ncbi:MAG TPA: hypothetical protein VL947_03560 [Cytophagales bacterium]|nr:hypothetical protein [Cytophagales bacterium]
MKKVIVTLAALGLGLALNAQNDVKKSVKADTSKAIKADTAKVKKETPKK